MYLVGDFNNWDTNATPCTKRRDGVFEVFLPDQHGEYSYYRSIQIRHTIPHLSKIKVRMTASDKDTGCEHSFYRVPTHIHYAVPDPLSHTIL